MSRKWGYQAAFASGGVEVETGTNKLLKSRAERTVVDRTSNLQQQVGAS
jgi:hypothetical protein